LLRRVDGRSFVVTAGFNDAAQGINQTRVWGLMERAEALLAKTR